MADTSITVDQIKAQFGEYYKNGGQGWKDIHSRLRESFKSIGIFTTINTTDSVLDSANTKFGEVLQAFQSKWTPKGSVEFVPVRIPLYRVKTDQSFFVDVIVDSWMEFATDLSELDRKNWPFVKWFIESYLLPQIQEDTELKAIYKGVRTDVVDGAAGPAVGAINGIRTIINAGITAGDITPFVTGALETDPVLFCTQVEDFVKGALPETYWEVPMDLNLSRALQLRYKEGRSLKYNINYAQENNMVLVKNFENITVKGYASHSGSNKLWMTPKNNAILAMNINAKNNTVLLEGSKREVDVTTDFRMGIGFLDKGLVFTNDQDLV